MKKLLCFILCAGLLACLAGCGLGTGIGIRADGPERPASERAVTETAEKTTRTNALGAGKTPPGAAPEGFAYTATYASSPTHFYAVTDEGLYSAPLNNIARQRKITPPAKYRNLTSASICGLSDQGLYVSWYGDDYDAPSRFATCLVDTDTFESTVLDDGKYECAPWLNAASGSLLFVARIGEGAWRMEALRLRDSKRETIFDDASVLFFSGIWLGHWHNTADGKVALELTVNDTPSDSGYILIDRNNKAASAAYRSIRFVEAWRDDATPQNRAEERLEARGVGVWRYVTCGSYVYYVEEDSATGQNNLYRVKPDSTGRELLRAKTNIYQLLALHGALYALAFVPSSFSDAPGYRVGFYSLKEDGTVDTELTCVWEGEDNVHSLYPLGNLVQMNTYFVYGCRDGYFVALYDPATGALLGGGEDL